jgi:hypothetical protein
VKSTQLLNTSRAPDLGADLLDDVPVLGDRTVLKRNSGGQESHPLARDQHKVALGDVCIRAYFIGLAQLSQLVGVLIAK